MCYFSNNSSIFEFVFVLFSLNPSNQSFTTDFTSSRNPIRILHHQRQTARMAPTKPSKDSKKSSKPLSSSSKVSKNKDAKRPPPKEVKAKARTEPSLLKKKQKREYTEEELDLPKLNMITPAGVVKPKGKKKGKKFVDDAEGMMTIMAMVNADKEGQIESKMMKARQLEEIRQARIKEQEARQAQKKSKLDNAKESIRNKKRKSDDKEDSKSKSTTEDSSSKKGKRKSVAFA